MRNGGLGEKVSLFGKEVMFAKMIVRYLRRVGERSVLVLGRAVAGARMRSIKERRNARAWRAKSRLG